MKTKKTISIIVAVLVLLIAAASVFVHLYLTDERIKSLVIPPAEKALGRKVEIGGVSVSLFSGIEVRDLAVAEADDRNVFAGIDSLVIKYRLLPLLRKKIEISRVILERPQIRISRDKAGKFNFASLAILAAPAAADGGEKPAAGKKADGSAISLGIEKIAVRDGRILVSDRTGAIPDTETDFDIDMNLELSGGAPSFNGRARATVRSEYGGLRPVVKVNADFDQERARAEFSVELDSEKMKLAATVRSYRKNPVTELVFTADRLNVEKLMALAARLPEKPAAAKAESAGNRSAEKAAAPPELPPVTGRIVIGRLTYLDLEAGNIAASFHTDSDKLFIDDLALATCGGRINGKTILTLSDPIAYEGKIAAENISIAALRKGLRQTGGGIADGKTAIDATFSGRGAAWPKLADHLSASGSYSLKQARITRNPYTELLAAALKDPAVAELTASDLKGDYEVKNGRLWLSGALASREIGLTGKGSVGIVAADLDFRITAAVPAATAAKTSPELAKALAGEGKTVKLGLTLRGPARDPRLGLDRAQLRNAAKKQARQRAAAEAEKLISKEIGDRPEAELIRGAAGALLNGLFGSSQ